MGSPIILESAAKPLALAVGSVKTVRIRLWWQLCDMNQ
jgi:hypothetical protein